MHGHKKLIVGAAIAALATPAAAYAGTGSLVPYVFGHGGTGVPLTKTCQRQPVTIPLGATWMQAKPGVERVWTIQSSELKCLTGRVIALSKRTAKVTAPDTCYQQAGPVPAVAEAKADRQGYHDEQGLVALQSWISGLAACEAAR